MFAFHSFVVLPSSCGYPPGPDRSTLCISLPAIDGQIGWKSNRYMAARAPMSGVVVLKPAQTEGGWWAKLCGPKNWAFSVCVISLVFRVLKT
jgi:hypothetical protein